MQIAAISALGTTWAPAAAVPASTSVAMASTSGTMMSGLISSNNACNSAAFAISNARYSCATCWAGAPAYESAAHTHAPSRMSSMATSLPSSPAPKNSTRVGCLPSGVPSGRLAARVAGETAEVSAGIAGEEVEVTAVFTAFSVIPTFCHAAMISPMRGSNSAACAAERVIQYWAKCGSPYHFTRVHAARPTPLQRGGLGWGNARKRD